MRPSGSELREVVDLEGGFDVGHLGDSAFEAVLAPEPVLAVLELLAELAGR